MESTEDIKTQEDLRKAYMNSEVLLDQLSSIRVELEESQQNRKTAIANRAAFLVEKLFDGLEFETKATRQQAIVLAMLVAKALVSNPTVMWEDIRTAFANISGKHNSLGGQSWLNELWIEHKAEKDELKK